MPPKPEILEGSLTDEWFQKPYAELITEAERVGAIIEPSEHTVTWRPVPICKCVLQEVYTGHLFRGVDSKGNITPIFVANPAIPRHAGPSFTACPAHPYTEAAAHHAALTAETRLVTGFERALLTSVPTIRKDVLKSPEAMTVAVERIIDALRSGTNPDPTTVLNGLTVNQYKEGQEYRYAFDANRRLNVDVSRMTAENRQAVRTLTTDPRFTDVIING